LNKLDLGLSRDNIRNKFIKEYIYLIAFYSLL